MHKGKLLETNNEWDNVAAREYEYAPLVVTEQINEYTMPSEILLYSPTDDDIFTKFHVGSSSEFKLRQIFLQVQLLKHEEDMLIEFDNFLSEQGIKLPEFMKPLSLRVLMFNKRRHPNTYIPRSVNHLINMFNWRVSTYPLSDMEPDLRRDLESGIIYWHGRDYSLRPILTIRLSKINKHFPVERFIRLIVFCMEWGMRYLMCPGKVETCLALIDIKGVSLTSFPISTMSEISSLLTNQYSFRLYRMFILHDSLFIQTVWSLMKQFLTDLQQHKIILSRNEIKSQLFKTVHPNQVEEHFGGLQKNKAFPFYPFSFPPGPFADPKLHPNNGFTRTQGQFDATILDNFSKVTNCHLLFNKYNVLGKLRYGNNPSSNQIVWDKRGLELLGQTVSSLLNVSLQDDTGSSLVKFDKKSDHVDRREIPISSPGCSNRRFSNAEQTEMAELRSCSFDDTNSTIVNTVERPAEQELSAEINIGIINTININSDIANIGDVSQHFIREYSVLSESPTLTENIAMIIGDSQSFFSASSSFYVNEGGDGENPIIEDLHHNLLIDNPCYDNGIFQSFGVMPFTMDIFRNSGKSTRGSLKSWSTNKDHSVNENSCSSNNSNTHNSRPSIMTLSNSDENITGTLTEDDARCRRDIADRTHDLKNSDAHSLIHGDGGGFGQEVRGTTPSSRVGARPPVVSMNTFSSCHSSLENAKPNGYLSSSYGQPRASRKSRIKSRIFRVISRIKSSRSSIMENT
ncbi:sec14 domain-containing protein [Cryptosporidium canis]|uniref:Sec14 domain-containing protein n=1 Tax=Cryptosporidium canis TaxID=195482 RepID=A0A9D5HYC2_9CRYT|nr:sec14 domain-containing protein [Cryptosporidium canis]